jgi:hypothetical protein
VIITLPPEPPTDLIPTMVTFLVTLSNVRFETQIISPANSLGNSKRGSRFGLTFFTFKVSLVDESILVLHLPTVLLDLGLTRSLVPLHPAEIHRLNHFLVKRPLQLPR